MTLSDDANLRRHVEALQRHLGPEALHALADSDVTELYVNPDGRTWLDTHSLGRVRASFEIGVLRVESFLNAAASYLGAEPLTSTHPQIQAELPLAVFRGARLQGFIPPVTPAPCFNLRLPSSLVYGLDDLVKQGVLSPEHRAVLARAVLDHENILVVGGTGSGKTTFANALLHEIAALCPHERVVILEDTAELQCRAADFLCLRTRAGLGLADLVKATLRTSPDRIFVGEVRDGAALAVLDAWATGHPGGCATFHATTPLGALLRFDTLAQRNNVPSQVALIAETIGLVVHLEGGNLRRRVREIARAGLSAGRELALEPLPGGPAEPPARPASPLLMP